MRDFLVRTVGAEETTACFTSLDAMGWRMPYESDEQRDVEEICDGIRSYFRDFYADRELYLRIHPKSGQIAGIALGGINNRIPCLPTSLLESYNDH